MRKGLAADDDRRSRASPPRATFRRVPGSRGFRRPIIIVGLPGAGKTTVGRRLAKRLRLPFVDTDREIERAANMTIPDLFACYGEGSFRDGERRVIARLVEDRPIVIATGGGAFINDRTRALILQGGCAIWLDADIDVLAERIAFRPGTRPLLRDRDPREALVELALVRNPIYALAHIHVRSQSGSHDVVVEKILEGLESASLDGAPYVPRLAI